MSLTTVTVLCLLMLAFFAAVWAYMPICAPGEVYVRGAIAPLVCVKGHN